MQFSTLVLLLSSFLTAWTQALEVKFDCPEVIVNEEPTSVRLNLVGGGIGSGEVVQLRTVLFTPGKRAPKFFGNISHTQFTTIDSANYELSSSYSLPTQKFKIGYSALVRFDDEEEWIDSELLDVRIEDPPMEGIKLVASISLIIATLVLVAQLSIHMATPGYWEARLPQWMHRFLPDYKTKKRN